jgi:sulfonate transport system permease protein
MTLRLMRSPAEAPLEVSGAQTKAIFIRPVLGLLIPLCVALAWEMVVRAGYFSGRLMPPPSRIYDELAELARTGELQHHASVSLLRVAAGFGLGAVSGTFLGANSGYSATVRRSD